MTPHLDRAARLASFVQRRTEGRLVGQSDLRRMRDRLDAADVVLVRADPARRRAFRRTIGRVGAALGPGGWAIVSLDRPADDETTLSHRFRAAGLYVHFTGRTAGTMTDPGAVDTLVVSTLGPPRRGSAPAAYRVLAIMTAYNEADVIDGVLERLHAQGAVAYVIDNWSTDGTFERVRDHVGQSVVQLERFPEQPGRHYEWRRLLERVEAVAAACRADWFTHHDADELRTSPWVGVRMVDALHHVAQLGYNAVDHTVVEHPPVDERFRPGMDVAATLEHFEFGSKPGHFGQIKAWQAQPVPVDLASSGGHAVAFPGRRVFPFNFLLHHYPVRSQAHGEHKVFADRRPRWSPDERERGWHKQYDEAHEATRFTRDPAGLEVFREAGFHERYLFERLARIGLSRVAPADQPP